MQKQNLKTNKSSKRWVIIVSVVAILAVLTDIFMIGNIAYLVKWTQCGSRPVVAGKISYIVGNTSEPVRYFIKKNPNMFDDIKVTPSLSSSVGLYCTLDAAIESLPEGANIEYR